MFAPPRTCNISALMIFAGLRNLSFDREEERSMNNDLFDQKETEERLHKVLQGAFAGPPTPLKDIPKKSGVTRASRAKKDDQRPRKRRQRKKQAA
jgi:hypothetical protein